MFPLSLFIYLSFPLSLSLSVPCSPSLLVLLLLSVFVSHFEVQLCCFL